MQQPQAPVGVTATAAPTASGEFPAEAPPKQVALAMDRLSHAGRLIADIRLGADRLLEALFVASDLLPHQSEKPIQLILKEEASMRQHLEDLRTVGRQLETSGVLNGSLRSRGNSWGLHMPLVCPDGAVVAYAWKRQLAGQAGASAVDRTRLALKAFTDQKRRFFPHLEDDPSAEEFGAVKKQCSSQVSALNQRDELSEDRTLSEVLVCLEKEAPNMKILTYQRLDWLKRASLLSSANENGLDLFKEQSFHRLRMGPLGAVTADQIAVVELLVPSVFRAIISLHPAGSVTPDAVAFFSPDEAVLHQLKLLRTISHQHGIRAFGKKGGSYIHSRGFSVYHVFRHITEHANKALQYFMGVKPEASLHLLLQWISSYQTLFTKVCSKCGRLLTMDKPSALLLPPVHRSYQQTLASTTLSIHPSLPPKDQSSDGSTAYHIGCSSDEGC